ncbi:hypothetical protein D3C79_737830 [compost metagenome]
MPAPPELLEVVRGIGGIEVVRQAKAQQQGDAGNQVGVAAEVEIDQEAVAIHAQQDLLGRIAARRFKHRVDPLAGQPGAAKEQLDHRQGDQAQSPLRLQHLTDTAGANLRQHVAGAVDRAGNQAGEERQVQGQVERRSRGHLAAVDRHQVADRVKGIERQTDRHQHFQHRQRHLQPGTGQGALHAADKEFLVLEQVEATQHQQQHQQIAEAPAGITLTDQAEQVHQGTVAKQDIQGVEAETGHQAITGRQQQDVLQANAPAQAPVDDEKQCEAEAELDRKEAHNVVHYVTTEIGGFTARNPRGKAGAIMAESHNPSQCELCRKIKTSPAAFVQQNATKDRPYRFAPPAPLC